MGKGLAIVVCAALTAMLGGCSDLMHRQPVASLKDDMAKPAHALSAPAKPESIKVESTKPEPAKTDLSVIDRAKAEQAARCGQRHIEHGSGTLKETENEKQLADGICVELHKYDYVR